MIVKLSGLRENQNSERIELDEIILREQLEELNELVMVKVLISFTLVFVPMLDSRNFIVSIHDNSNHKVKHNQRHKHHRKVEIYPDDFDVKPVRKVIFPIQIEF